MWSIPVVPLPLQRGEEPRPSLLPRLVGLLRVLLFSLLAGVPSLVPQTSRPEGVRRLSVLLSYWAL
jgi:hypothetical protein